MYYQAGDDFFNADGNFASIHGFKTIQEARIASEEYDKEVAKNIGL
jgi:hypothetical protein